MRGVVFATVNTVRPDRGGVQSRPHCDELTTILPASAPPPRVSANAAAAPTATIATTATVAIVTARRILMTGGYMRS